MSLPGDSLSAEKHPAPFKYKHGAYGKTLTTDYEMGGVALSDPTEGLLYQLWKCYADREPYTPPVHPWTIYKSPGVTGGFTGSGFEFSVPAGDSTIAIVLTGAYIHVEAEVLFAPVSGFTRFFDLALVDSVSGLGTDGLGFSDGNDALAAITAGGGSLISMRNSGRFVIESTTAVPVTENVWHPTVLEKDDHDTGPLGAPKLYYYFDGQQVVESAILNPHNYAIASYFCNGANPHQVFMRNFSAF